jgi:hypothetical protein
MIWLNISGIGSGIDLGTNHGRTLIYAYVYINFPLAWYLIYMCILFQDLVVSMIAVVLLQVCILVVFFYCNIKLDSIYYL